MYDIVVIGAGHAGCEAALAAARMGKKTCLLTTALEAVAMMACNPSIGGTGKGHLVREIDALGGEMGLNIDKTFIQSRMLNTAKGPAVHSLRAQADKQRYHEEMLATIRRQENLDLREDEAVDLVVEKDREGRQVLRGVVLASGETLDCEAAVVASGTFLRGKIFQGEVSYESGPSGLAAATKLADSLKKYGLPLRRFKTGTPCRALKNTLDYDKMQEQKGDERIVPFSFMNEDLACDQISCWLTYTNEETHRIIRENYHRSGLYTGEIEGVGPRYCPSIETKIQRFADRSRHQTFIEPEGRENPEVYVQGLSSSLPIDAQEAFYHTIPGLEHMVITKYAYAIEYDCIDPLAVRSTLESRDISGLFCAGQFNGSSGYEEAAAQGLIAGINAVQKLRGLPAFVPQRSEAYIGVLIDDLTTKGTDEPYRIMTSRAEYRLVLRQDNADLRLTEKGYELGLVSEERYQRFLEKKKACEQEVARLENTTVSPVLANPFLESVGSSPIAAGTHLSELLKRPEVSYEALAAIDPDRPALSQHAAASVEVRVKYAGYIEKQEQQIARFKKLEDRKLAADFDYSAVESLRIEAREKLSRFKPASVGQASRISGVSPADINVLLVYLEKQRRKR